MSPLHALAVLELRMIRQNLTQSVEMARHDDSVAMLWLHVGALTSALDAVLAHLTEDAPAVS